MKPICTRIFSFLWLAPAIIVFTIALIGIAFGATVTPVGMNPSGQFIITSNADNQASLRVFNNSPGRTLVTTAAAANGYTLSATRDADVRYSITIVSTATIGGSSMGTVVLEICPTNSATATDWIEVARFSQGQTFGVVIGISCVQTISGSLRATIPASYYARLRSTSTGTVTYAVNSGQEILQ